MGLEEVLGLGEASELWFCGFRRMRDLLCQGAQGGRGRGTNKTTFQRDGDEEGDKGVWMPVWVEDVDAVHKTCVEARLEVTLPPSDMPWNVREMHIRHPDGHVFRISRGKE